MKKKIISLMMCAALAMTAMTGCGGTEKKAENGEINIFVWTEYVPESVFDKFEEETGIKCNVSTYSSTP